MLIQAMGNIVANAIKYSGNPSLEIWILAIGDIEEIACIDHGCSIPREHWDRLIERFYLVNKEHSRKLGSTGISLAIVKHIIRLHYCTVTIMETPEGGAIFLIQLPSC